MFKNAIFSPCKRYRYLLQRSWSQKASRHSTVTFIALNPSTADAIHDDPTIRKCIAYARAWQFKTLIMVNLFAWRATDPKELLKVKNPIGALNNHHIDEAVKRSAQVVACWGEYGSLMNRASDLRARYPRRLKCLRTNNSGEPTHPLYLPASLTPVKLTKNVIHLKN